MRKKRYDIKGSTFLVTGGTGSFGHQVVSALLPYKPNHIVILSRDEKKQYDMRNFYNNPLLKFIIGDVRDATSIDKAMHGIDYVFHAAALKQVPTCEFFPLEAVKTNILGTQNVIHAAIDNKVKKVVALSTDKAVYPINVIGMTKAMMEKIIVAEAKNLADSGRSMTKLCTVRYGNVLYTRGSVVPYFVNLMKENKKITITNIDMTRFLLPLAEAVDLVLYALNHGRNGHIYVRKSPSATLETLVKALCSIFKYENGFTEVGIRAGEKMHETLVTREELIRTKSRGIYYDIPPESQGLDYNQYFFKGKRANIKKIVPFTSENTHKLNVEETVKMLLRLPEINKVLSIDKRP